MNQLENDIIRYWKERSSSYGVQHRDELHTSVLHKWQSFLQNEFDQASRPIKKVLDVGTGPGFLAIALADLGYEVTAIDFTEAMLAQAKANAAEFNVNVQWERMNATDLRFADETFDAVVSRNVTWNLAQPQSAYQEWLRVIKADGLLLNFDANWYRYLFDLDSKQQYLNNRERVVQSGQKDFYGKTDIPAMEKIARQIPLGQYERPKWDEKVLTTLGAKHVQTQEALNEQLWSEEQQLNFAFSPLFAISVIK